MIKSMTGYGHAQINHPALGRVSLEIRSLNHRFLEIVFNLPARFNYLEDKLRKEIEKKTRRGRLLVNLNIPKPNHEKVTINKDLLKEYLHSLHNLSKELALKDKVGLEMLLRLPGVLSLAETEEFSQRAWHSLRELLKTALSRLEVSRKKGGKALYQDLKTRIEGLVERLKTIKKRAHCVIAQKASQIENIEERMGFLKNVDIAEELTLLKFHLNNFKPKLNKSQAVGKELDFIAQEIQREINTLAAKSFDVRILGGAVEMKSQIEKVREQLQNVE